MLDAVFMKHKILKSCPYLLLQGEGGSLRSAGVGKLANLGVSVQRRWNNVLSDASRQMVVELFLGLRLPVHLPSVHLPFAVPHEPVSDGDDSDDESPLPTPRQVSPAGFSDGIVCVHSGGCQGSTWRLFCSVFSICARKRTMLALCMVV